MKPGQTKITKANRRKQVMQRKQTHKPRPNGLSQGFTIVELLIVIVIIAILVAIVTVSYNGITRQVKIASLKSDLKNASTQIELTNAKSGSYPTNEGQIDGDIKSSPNNTLSYKGGGTAYCVTATNTQANLSFSITHDGEITEGDCPFMSGGPMQLVTSDNCPTTRTLAVDARDNHTYWIQKLADGKCWMLTNLAYAGAGDNTYEDVIPTGDGITGLHGPDNDGIRTYTEAKYYIPPDANPTTIPQTPSVNSDGGVSESTRQFGYLYNWCAAMGNQQIPAQSINLPILTTQSIALSGTRIPA
ncbi:type IV pilin protein [Schaalia sp. JY-X169]|uniref:type IV pilin protein n=1 Tax=Schaalia sp. JY-X169 TaxID=2758572 RepID=UPI0015F4CFFE|nr:prepilin-type N-terminal cleavage/methylation domain-containing protein [Schaalia sp. JY-X169]